MKNLNIINLGTSLSLSTYKNDQDNNIIECYSCSKTIDINNEYGSSLLLEYIIETKLKRDPSTGYYSSINNYFSNTTSFERRGLYSEDYLYLNQYYLTSSATNNFSRTFPRCDLQGDQFVVACTAFCLQELGHEVNIIVHPDEITLMNFCRENNWNYKIIEPPHN
jgi:hypothetical protein